MGRGRVMGGVRVRSEAGSRGGQGQGRGWEHGRFGGPQSCFALHTHSQTHVEQSKRRSGGWSTVTSSKHHTMSTKNSVELGENTQPRSLTS